MANIISRFVIWVLWLLRVLRILRTSKSFDTDIVVAKDVDSWSSSSDEPDLESGVGREDMEGGVVDFGLKMRTGTVRTRKFCFKQLAFNVELLVPCIPINTADTKSSYSKLPLGPYKQFSYVHAQFDLSIQPWTGMNIQNIGHRAVAELCAIEQTFPQLKSREIVLAMAAWLVTLCAVDDVVEALEPECAYRALTKCVEVLRGPIVIRPATKSPSHTLPEEKAVRIVQTFMNHINTLLPNEVTQSFFQSVHDTISGLGAEPSFRRANATDIHAYLSIRVLTIGIAPFFALLGISIYPHGHSRKLSPVLENIQRALSIAIGMQNDLIGLEKDLIAGETMNLVAVLAASMRENKPHMQEEEPERLVIEGVRRAVAIHNWAVSTAVAEWQLLQQIERPGVEGVSEREISHAMLSFIESHLMWASSVKRYAVE